ncbi:MAG TPA: FAD-binding oxidoreductase [Thermoanaerobaculia bacterium]|nr:FAD-binding oxidoreductase [Thermoanaerobaculia bacterium]
MLDRRELLKALGLAALAPGACVTRPVAAGGGWVNDVHSQMNATWVSSILTPRSAEELALLLRNTRGEVGIAGGRHAMGGQQFASKAPLIDVRRMNRILSFDREQGIVEVESGIEWPQLITWLTEAQRGQSRQWGIRQKQTGADRLTLGGSLAANVHGRGLAMKPIIGDIESFVLLDGGGNRVECSRTRNDDLFSLAIGGYGLFGVISSIRLRLSPRRKVQRVVELQSVESVMPAFEERIADGYLYGDFQFSIDEKSEDFLRRGVFSCYRPVPDDTPMPDVQAELAPADWMKLLYLTHADRNQAYEQYTGYYLASSGQVYWSDEHQLSFYPDDYHLTIDRLTSAATRATEMITELYVPRPRLAAFMSAAAGELRRLGVPVIYGTVRLIERDDESFLAWARQRYACVIFNLHTEHTPEALSRAADAFRALIDLAMAREGSYFLTYHRWARRDQVEGCYPQFAEFLRRKRHRDAGERFQSEWYRHYRAMFDA